MPSSRDRSHDQDQGEHELEALIERIDLVAQGSDPVSVGEVLHATGRRSFAPVLLLAGLTMVAPVVGDIPGVPVAMGVLVILVAAQLLLHREHIWLPGWLLRRSVERSKVRKTAGWLRRPARFVDRWTKPRMTWLAARTGERAIAVASVIIAAATPIMELVPFSANIAGISITAFGLSLLARDGLLAFCAIAFSVVAIGLIVYQFV